MNILCLGIGYRCATTKVNRISSRFNDNYIYECTLICLSSGRRRFDVPITRFLLTVILKLLLTVHKVPHLIGSDRFCILEHSLHICHCEEWLKSQIQFITLWTITSSYEHHTCFDAFSFIPLAFYLYSHKCTFITFNFRYIPRSMWITIRFSIGFSKSFKMRTRLYSRKLNNIEYWLLNTERWISMAKI